jgi:hypothetical protein
LVTVAFRLDAEYWYPLAAYRKPSAHCQGKEQAAVSERHGSIADHQQRPILKANLPGKERTPIIWQRITSFKAEAN